MILVYTGGGKGKTSACVGQATRALGNGLAVVFAQFIKRPGIAGEQEILARLLGDNFRAGGIGFYRDKSELAAHQQACLGLLAWAAARPCQMLILDEAIYALNYEMLSFSDLSPHLEKAQGGDFHIVLSGRNAPAWLCEQAHIVTEMLPVKHVYENGITAAKGIEY